MATLPRFPVALPFRGVALAILCAVYLLAGLTGHDPWKNDDAIHFGITYGLLNGGDWRMPQLAGHPYPEAPPLYYWVAAACGRLFGWLLPLHDAVRLATGLFGALLLGFLAFASRILSPPSLSRTRDLSLSSPSAHGAAGSNTTVLIAIGSIGLLVPIHDTQPLIALLAASAAAYAGFALLLQRPLAGGLLAGCGIGMGFLAGGVTALITLTPLLFLLPLSRHWRSAAGLRGLGIAVAVAVPLCASWPLLLAWQAPDTHTLGAWWSNAAGAVRYQSGWRHALPDYAELLAWFAWPALPLAAWAVWLHRRRLNQPALLLPLLGAVTTLLTLLLLHEPRPNQALPLLVPLILLAANGANRLQRGAANAFDWFGMMTFTIVAGLVWLGGIAMISGVPPQIAHNFAKLEPGFVAHFSTLSYAIAALLSMAWLWLIFTSPRSPWRATTHWAAGATLMWVLLMTLWLPWIDYGKSYRGVAASLRHALLTTAQDDGHPYPCIAGRDIGDAQRVSLQYFAGIVTLHAETPAASACPLLLEQDSAQDKTPHPGWRKIWEGHRPGDRSERLRLYRREN
ncbi:MAG: glycosyltransferase family 39 protein [Betaproteobacteria bacterium]|nr:glycosyltransferase family 39 protein [Betaproteobacteria bacterium]